MLRFVRRQPLPGAGSVAGPLLALVVLVVVGVLTVDLLNGTIPAFGKSQGGGNGGPAKTPTPSNVIVVPVDPRSNVPGSIVYVKDGNLWLQSGATARQLTSTGQDSMPSFSPDGAWIYYIETKADRGSYGCGGPVDPYTEQVPNLVRIAIGGGSPQHLLNGKYELGSLSWFYFLRQPVVSPDGRRVALMSDAPHPCLGDVVLQFFDLSTRRMTSVGLPEDPPLGHQDPAWSPDGRVLLYVRNGRSGGLGTPVIYRYDLRTRSARALTGPGYLQPAWSPDGRFVAVTHLGTFGSDVVILDATNGHELQRVTTDGTSSAPAWSPAGDAIAYLSTTGGITDLHVVTLTGSAPSWIMGQPVVLTEQAGLDPGSRPSWFIPADRISTAPAGSPSGAP
jgi:Tol biopolymer transport system component